MPPQIASRSRGLRVSRQAHAGSRIGRKCLAREFSIDSPEVTFRGLRGGQERARSVRPCGAGRLVRRWGQPVGLSGRVGGGGAGPSRLLEPYLVRQGFLSCTGRQATDLAFRHLGLAPPEGALFLTVARSVRCTEIRQKRRQEQP